MQMTPAVGAAEAAAAAISILDRIRATAPRIHCITNSVAQAFTANVLLAVGAVPSMTLAREEIADFVATASALVVNLGTLDAARRDAIAAALDAARAARIPWVLDPVFVDRVPGRLAFAGQLLAAQPSVVRLNASEFSALTATAVSPGAAASAASSRKIVFAVSGAVDVVTDGARVANIANGHSFMARVTAMGCAESAVLAACLAVEPDRWRAAVAAHVLFGVAGECAAEQARGPGSFPVAIIDALHGLDADNLKTRARVTP